VRHASGRLINAPLCYTGLGSAVGGAGKASQTARCASSSKAISSPSSCCSRWCDERVACSCARLSARSRFGLESKRLLAQQPHLAWREFVGARGEVRGLVGEQLYDVLGKPDVEAGEVAVDQQPMVALMVCLTELVGLQEHANQRVCAEAGPAV